LALTEPTPAGGEGIAPKAKKSAKDVIANTTKENTDKWLQAGSDDEDTPPPPDSTAVEQGQTQTQTLVKDEIQDQVMVAEAREEGVIPNGRSGSSSHKAQVQ
jgi:hypothetical protein